MSLVSGPGRGGSGNSNAEVGVDPPTDPVLCVEKHVEYIKTLDTRRDELEYWHTEHLRLNGLYWGLTACYLIGHSEALPRNQVIEFVLSCYHENGGFGAAPGHDSHMLYTVSAVQILAILDAFQEFEQRYVGGIRKTGQFIASLQDKKSGSFAGDEWGELDTRFLYGALNALSLLGQLDLIDLESAVAHVQSCVNFDGGFGTSPEAESHAGQVFVCLAALSISKRLDLIVDKDKIGAWLSERQLPNGGLNGRPEKREDVCYSWWVGSSLKMIERLHWIDRHQLAKFILKCQDTEQGGISDRPEDMVDVFHTFFGLAGLSLVGWEGLDEIDPVYCVPRRTLKRLGLAES